MDQRDEHEEKEVHGGVEERQQSEQQMTHARATWDECELEPMQCAII